MLPVSLPGHFKTVNLANSLYKCQDIGFSLFFKVIRLLFACSRISPGELIPVVSETSNGLAWKGGFIDRPKITSNMSIDDYTNPGMYGLDGCQDSPYKYGGLIIFRANVLVVQIVYDMQGSNRPKYRQNWANQGWQSWYSF